MHLYKDDTNVRQMKARHRLKLKIVVSGLIMMVMHVIMKHVTFLMNIYTGREIIIFNYHLLRLAVTLASTYKMILIWPLCQLGAVK